LIELPVPQSVGLGAVEYEPALIALLLTGGVAACRAEIGGEGTGGTSPGPSSPSGCPQPSEALQRLARKALAPEVHLPWKGSSGNLESIPALASDVRLKLHRQRPPSLRLKPRETADNRGLGMLDCNWSKALLSRLTLIVLAALSYVTVGYGQAAVEYALKSGGSAVSASRADAGIGGCKVDSTVMTCLGRSYPKTTIAVIGLLTLMILRWLTRANRVRS
jgi:hypothetical protein